MDRGSHVDRWRPTLATWALATFDVTALVVLLLLVGYPTGVASDVLPALNTLVGVVAFVYLWTIVVLATARALADVSVLDGSLRALVLRAVAAGGASGLAFFLGPFVVVAAETILRSPGTIAVLAYVALVGGVVAVAIGVVVGLAFGLLDLALYRVADGLLTATDERGTETGGATTMRDRR